MDNPDTNAGPMPSGGALRPVLRTARGQPYVAAIGARLKVLLALIFAAVALLGASGAYLFSITMFEKGTGLTYSNQFTLWIFIAHILIGVLFLLPFVVFGVIHLLTAWNRPNRVAVRLGVALFVAGILACASGVALIQLEHFPQLTTGTLARAIVYWLHVVAPIGAVWLYVAHRRAGPAIQWRWGYAWCAAVGSFVVVMGVMHSQDPRKWYAVGPSEGEKYFEPSKARTASGNFIPAESLMMDDYCLKCHQDAYNGWFHSSHHFSSFNNPPYLFSVRETRQVSLKRDGNVRPARWCAGCHDPVPFFSGAFDDPNFDDVKHPTAQAGITCTTCHAITNINSTIGNADFTIEEPIHYPFAYSKNAVLQWINNQLVKARPEVHKKTFLKPFHRTAEFCSTCHKVGLPIELNHYKEFLRGQNHYDSYLLSGVSGVGARSFYYPSSAKTRCADCHMPLAESADFGSRDFDDSGNRKIHSHFFPAANTGLAALLAINPDHAAKRQGLEKAIKEHADFLRGTDPQGTDKKLRIDLFGIKEGGTVSGPLTVLRPNLPRLKAGEKYLVEVVIRTVNMGHPFPQGTADSNEIWVDFQARAGDRVIGRSGALSGVDDSGQVDEWSHFVNVLMLDRDGNRIDRRNPQDIFTPLYDHQIPPGAAQVVHYVLNVPADVKSPIELQVKLRYRKFDYRYLSLVYEKEGKIPKLPIVDICEDKVVLPVAGLADEVPSQESPIKPAWQRWNDYGIGCYLEGGLGSKKGELKQAELAFKHLLTLPEKAAHAHGYVNAARVYFDEGRLNEAVESLNKALAADPPAPWTVAWFSGLVDAQNSYLDKAIEKFKQILSPSHAPTDRKFDFSRDYVVINELATTLFKRAQQEERIADRDRFLAEAVEYYESTLQLDPEDLDAHYGLAQSYTRLGESVQIATERSTAAGLEDPLTTKLMATLADPQRPHAARMDAAVRLLSALQSFGSQPSSAASPKLPHLLALARQCRTIYAAERDGPVRAAAAGLLGQLHRQMHGIYKPDDNAKDRAVRIYREKHPAAAAASQAVVLYPTDRFVPGGDSR